MLNIVIQTIQLVLHFVRN